MAKTVHRLSPLKVKNLTKAGWYPDGMGLYLQVSKSGSKSWVYRYQKGDRERRHGLGGYPSVGLEKARKEAQECRELRREGHDPIEHKKHEATARELQEARNITFRECALAYIDSHQSGWKSRKHAAQWRNTLETYAFPEIGSLSVQDVDIGMVLAILEPLWKEKTETATRVRQRIENILDWAYVRKYRTGENPARWRGHLDKILPKRSKVQKVKHFPAMPYLEVPDYFRELRENDSISAKCLAFIILTATRSAESREAPWSEFNIDNKIWEIPADRMKADRAHRVPLSEEAVNILHEVKQLEPDELVFPGMRRKRPVSDTTIRNLLRKSHAEYDIHGFRSSFRDWCAEMTSYPREVAEAAMAHMLTDKTEAAYQRGDIFDKRRKLMDAWADYCLNGGTSAEVIPIQSIQEK